MTNNALRYWQRPFRWLVSRDRRSKRSWLPPVSGQTGQHGFTFSDLTQRLLPAIVLDAYPHRRVDPDSALNIARDMAPTAPFQDAAP